MLTQPTDDPSKATIKALVRKDFFARYEQIGGWPGETLNQETIDERFELFWRKYQETKDWGDRFDEHFGAIQRHRQWYSDIKKEFSDWYYVNKGPTGEALSQDVIDKRFAHFFKSYQDSDDIRIDMKNHFDAVLKRREQNAAMAMMMDTSGDTPQAVTDDVNEPTSINTDVLLDNVKGYRAKLQSLKDANINPTKFFWSQPASRELYTPHMIVAENLRAEAIAEFMEDDAFKLKMHYFDSEEDFAWAMAQSAARSNIKGIVEVLGGHFIYVDVDTKEDRVSLVGIEPANAKIGESTLRALNDLLGESPNVIHNLSLTALNVQKAVMGCASFAANIGLDVGAAGPRKAIVALHAKQQERDPGDAVLYNDSFGYSLDASVYGLAQSEKQVASIVTNVKNDNRNLAEMPHNKKQETLYTHNAHRRVKQEVVDLKTKQPIALEFSSALDDKRLKGLDRLIDCLEMLKTKHGTQKAGQIFAGYLSTIRIGLQPDWDRHLTEAPRLVPNWDASAGPAQLQFIASTTDKLDENQRKKVMLDIMEAIPKWTSPGLRLHSLKLANRFIKSDTNAGIVNEVLNKLRQLIRECPVFLGRHGNGTDESWAQKELAAVLRLNDHLMQASANTGGHLHWLNELTQQMPHLNSPALRLELGKYLIGRVAENCRTNAFNAEHTKILTFAAAYVMDGWNSGPNESENDKKLTERFDALFDFQAMFPGNNSEMVPNPSTEFGAILEMAVNRGVQGANEIADANDWLRISAQTNALENDDPDWLSINDIDGIAEENRLATSVKKRKFATFDLDPFISKPATKQPQQTVASSSALPQESGIAMQDSRQQTIGSPVSQARIDASSSIPSQPTRASHLLSESPTRGRDRSHSSSSRQPYETRQQTHDRLNAALTESQRTRLKSSYPNGYQLIDQPTITSARVRGYRIHKEDAPANAGYAWSALIKLDIVKQQPQILILRSNVLNDEDKAIVQNATNPNDLIAVNFQRTGPAHGASAETAPARRGRGGSSRAGRQRPRTGGEDTS